jgi:hypothetical protein
VKEEEQQEREDREEERKEKESLCPRSLLRNKKDMKEKAPPPSPCSALKTIYNDCFNK